MPASKEPDFTLQAVEDSSVRAFWDAHFDKKMPGGIHVFDFSSEAEYQKFLAWFNEVTGVPVDACPVCEMQRSKAIRRSNTGELAIFTAPGPSEANELLHLLTHIYAGLPTEEPPYIR